MSSFSNAANNASLVSSVVGESDAYLSNDAVADVTSHVEMVSRYVTSGRSSGGAPPARPGARGLSAGRLARDAFRQTLAGLRSQAPELFAAIRQRRLDTAAFLRSRVGLTDFRATQYARRVSRLNDRMKG